MTKDWPRRNQMFLWAPAEKAISAAIEEVEKTGCDVRLTDAVVLLGEAKDKVADFVDNVPHSPLRAYALADAANTLINYIEAHGWGTIPEPYDSINPLLRLLGRKEYGPSE